MGWFPITWTRVTPGLDARIKAQPSLLMPELPIYFVIFPLFQKKVVSFVLSFFLLAGGSAVLIVLDSGDFPRELSYRQPFLSLVSRFLSFSCSFFYILVVLSCSWGVRKRGFFYLYFGRFCGKVECCIVCRTFVLSSDVLECE